MRVVLCLSGSISAYKAPLIVRQLIKAGADVRVVATASALEFVSPLALQNLSGRPVISDLFGPSTQRDGSWHIEMAHWCEHLLWAPCSAASLARLANGLCDDAPSLVAISLPQGSSITLAPAMDSTMWQNPATQRNVRQLMDDGVRIIEPEVGPLASGLFGPGRLPEPEELVSQIGLTCDPSTRFRPGAKVLITAGPTQERLDEVRYLSNRSSGKMGYALAEQARKLGARVILVSGPVALDCPIGVERIWVESADEMLAAVQAHFTESELCICSAAVADYRPRNMVVGKLKKEEMGVNPVIELELNSDILAWCGKNKRAGQTVVGFALEAKDHLTNGWSKLERKGCDMVVLNQVQQGGGGMGAEQNQVTILSSSGGQLPLPSLPKQQCALEILKATLTQIYSSSNLGGSALNF